MHQPCKYRYAVSPLCRYLSQTVSEEAMLAANPQNREKLTILKQALGALGFNSLVSYMSLCYLWLK